jgi:protein TonB
MLDDQSRRGLHGFVFAASFLIHATLAAKLRAGVAEAPARTPRSQVQVELAPPPLETPALIPEPPPASTALRQPNAPVARPVAARVPQSTTTAQPDAPDNSALPVSDEGLLPQTAPGGGVSGPASEPTQVAPAVEPPVARALPAPVIQAKEGANYLNNPRPAYPRLAQREGWEGKVVLRVRVLPNGHVGQTTLQKSAGHSALDEAALEVVKRWTFVPATQGGLPVAGWVTVPLEFQVN